MSRHLTYSLKQTKSFRRQL